MTTVADRLRRQVCRQERARCRPAIRAATSCSARASRRKRRRVWGTSSRTRVAKGAKVLSGGASAGADHAGDGGRRRHPGHAPLRRRVVRPGGRVIRVNGDEEAIRIANDTEYGLSASVYSAATLASALEGRQAHRIGHLPHQWPDRARRGANAFRRHQGERLWPFRRQAAIDEFTELRWITIQTEPMHYPF